MNNYLAMLKLLIVDNKKQQFYNEIIKLTNKVLEVLSKENIEEKINEFNNLLSILEAAMKTDDAVVIMDIIEYEYSKFINLEG